MVREIDPPWPEGAVAITVWRNPLDPTDCITYAAKPGKSLIWWLRRNFPDGFGRPINILWDGQPHEVEYSDRIMQPGDVIGLYVTPAGAAFGAVVLASILTAAASIAITLALNLIFGKPKTPGAAPKPDPVYSLSGATNSARLGDPVPAIYGKVITVPDWASQPYTFYQAGDQYLDQLLVIGQGRYQIDNVMVGDTPVSALGDPSQVTYQVFDSSQHLQAMGTIEGVTGIMENVITSPEVSNQELSGIASGGDTVLLQSIATATAPNSFTLLTLPIPASLPGTAFSVSDVVDIGGFNPNGDRLWTVSAYNPATGVITTIESTVVADTRSVDQFFNFTSGASTIASGPFVVGKPGVRGNRIMLDIVFPNGLYVLSNSGRLDPRTVNITIGIEPIDDSGAPAGAPISHDEAITRASNTPQRMTFAYDVPVGRYKVRLTRLTGAPPDTQTVDNLVWTALKFRLINAVTPVYGDATLIAVRIRATNGIGSEAASRVRVACTRLLAPLGAGVLIASRDPADAFVDVMINQVYGARRPLAEVDIARLTSLKAHWAGARKVRRDLQQQGHRLGSARPDPAAGRRAALSRWQPDVACPGRRKGAAHPVLQRCQYGDEQPRDRVRVRQARRLCRLLGRVSRRTPTPSGKGRNDRHLSTPTRSTSRRQRYSAAPMRPRRRNMPGSCGSASCTSARPRLSRPSSRG